MALDFGFVVWTVGERVLSVSLSGIWDVGCRVWDVRRGERRVGEGVDLESKKGPVCISINQLITFDFAIL